MANVVVSGDVHVGKTTAVRKVIADPRVCHWRVAGFVTSPVWGAGGERLGLEIEDLRGGVKRTLARTDRVLGGPVVGPYSFDLGVMQWADYLIDETLGTACDLMIVDEIGRLELESGCGFQHTLASLERTDLQCSVVVVRQYLVPLFMKRLPTFRAQVIPITFANRDSAPECIVATLLGRSCALCAGRQDSIIP